MQGEYDFSDWEPGEQNSLINCVKESVRDNLRHAFKIFGDGLWVTQSFDNSKLLWSSVEWDSDPVSITIGPDDLKECLFEGIEAHLPFSESPKTQDMHNKLCLYVDIIKEWKAVIDESLEYANSMLNLPIEDVDD
jgi:hypothetical protein